MVDLLEGTIEIQNEKNGGAIFTIYLPKNIERKYMTNRGDGHMLKVAIAEDDFRVAQIQEEFLLKIKDVKVIGKALNAKETMELLQREEIDLLLLDNYLPDGIGTDLLPKIHADFPNVDVIMVTAANENYMLEKAIRNGVSNYLIKPVTLEKFVRTIEDYKKKEATIT